MIRRRYMMLTEEQDATFLAGEEALSRSSGLKVTHQELLLRMMKFCLYHRWGEFLDVTSQEIKDEVALILQKHGG